MHQTLARFLYPKRFNQYIPIPHFFADTRTYDVPTSSKYRSTIEQKLFGSRSVDNSFPWNNFRRDTFVNDGLLIGPIDSS